MYFVPTFFVRFKSRPTETHTVTFQITQVKLGDLEHYDMKLGGDI